ncbi:unnamed protein product [Oikopleura dioica]|uniref:Uncharacterized protein n=1 Tax=Oikopleura dioica TaxID=34765 RepID=E4WR97_OIKDI|nr:unnamed protein product [Oikopleura dioica]CBY34768.1 unnamed protein product [Oikopleura dioica]CBY39843.1 unnamed protein product [Oikopleura dioica]
MKQARCNADLMFADKEMDIVCPGSGGVTDVKTSQVCKLECIAAHAIPPEISCLSSGWDFADSPKCDATAGGVNPAGQIGLILFVLVALSVGTFLYQRHRRNKEDKDPQSKEAKTTDGNTDHKYFDKKTVVGMGKDGLDNLQTLKANALSPLPQPRSRPAGGYHPAGKGIHDFMGTCTIGTISEKR